MKLTDTFVKRKQGNGNVQKHSDGGGLFLYITPQGSKSWRLAYRFMGKQKLLAIGPYPAISLKEARERREEAKKLLVNNIDPSTAKQEAKRIAASEAKSSFATVAREWVEKYSGDWSASYKSHVLHRLEDMVFPYIGKRPIKSITAPELLEVLRKIEGRGAICVAHLTMRECGRVFRYAIATGRAERDVAADLRGAITPLRTGNHFASVTDRNGIGKLLLALDDITGTFHMQRALQLAPYVFVRAKELAAAEWAEIDFEEAEWRIPAEKMKMRQMHIVPLSRQAIAILRELHTLTGEGRFLFPGTPRKGSKDTSIRSMSLVFALRRTGYTKDEMTFHGFRSMASTVLNELGYNRDWIERQLAHAERNGVRRSYNYAEYLAERRTMMQNYADILDELRGKARAVSQ
jgi:Integrase